MYERFYDSEGSVVGVRIQRDLDDRQTRELMASIAQRARQYGPVRLLVVFEAEPGLMGAESLYENLRFAKLAGRDLAKMAVMGKQGWDDTWVGLFGLFGGIQANYYDAGQMAEALAWLKA